MASITIMVGGAVLNAAAFIRSNFLARVLGGGDKAAQEEKVRHYKALEAYQAAYSKCTHDRTKLHDWIVTKAQIKAKAKQDFTNTDYTFKLYNQAHLDGQMVPPKDPLISISQASSRKMANSCSLLPGLLLRATQPSGSLTQWIPNSQRYSTALRATAKALPLSKNCKRAPRSQKTPQKSG